ncbi:MAG TPA: cation:proton antiporter [Gemmatimonadaceae bacterium]|nr:cation:proton antiporter [Gemmatimonadaceae bacterium]
MPHETTLIATVAAGLGLAFVFGYLAARIQLPPIVGYLFAGIVIGPFTPGYVANVPLAAQLAEIGVILLMFGVGLHFSPRDLLAVRRIAIPGALGQIAVATLLTAVAVYAYGWSWSAGLIFGLSLSVASTVVLLRALEQRGMVASEEGHIAIGWLIVEDLVTVFILVLLPAFASSTTGGTTVAAPRGPLLAVSIALVKAAAFLLLMLFAGRRVIPWLLASVVKTGSRELFTLAVVALALGIAVGAAALFGVSFALGAFFAGVVIGESDSSHQAAADALPLRDAFAVLFFVSVGMLFDPRVLIQRPLEVLIVVLIIMVGKSLAAFGIVRALRYPLRTALVVSAGLSQIGELSFILIGLAISLKLVPPEGRDLVLAGALVSIILNPVVWRLVKVTAPESTAQLNQLRN